MPASAEAGPVVPVQVRSIISNASATNCRCFDGSAYQYWYVPGNANATTTANLTWVLYFQGGPTLQSLRDVDHIADEYLSVPDLEDVLLDGDFGDALSSNEDINPHLASATKADMLALNEQPPERVVVVARGFNGAGALAHATALASALKQPPWNGATQRLWLVLDDVWYTDHDNILQESLLSVEDTISFYNPPNQTTAPVNMPAWEETYRNEFARLCRNNTLLSDNHAILPCCLDPACLLQELHAATDKARVALLSSKYNPYPMFLGLLRGASATQAFDYLTESQLSTVQQLSDLSNFFEEHAGLVVEQLTQATNNANVTLPPIITLASPCLTYGTTAQTQLDFQPDGVLDPSLLSSSAVVSSWNVVFPGTNTSTRDTVMDWLLRQDAPSAFLAPACKGVACDPSCPNIIGSGLTASPSQWLSVIDFAVIVFVGTLLAAGVITGQIAWLRTRFLMRKLTRLELMPLLTATHAHKRNSKPHRMSSHVRRVFRKRHLTKRSEVLRNQLFTRLERSQRIGLAADGLSYWTPGENSKQILHNVSVFANPGQITAIMGPSGCGKTTLMDVLIGRRKVGKIRGKCMINGCELHHKYEERTLKHRVAYVEQLCGAYFNDMTVRENAMFNAMLRLPSSMPTEEKLVRALSALKTVNLLQFADQIVDTGSGGLSGGQKRRLAVAMELLLDPAVLAMDEPTSGLDSNGTWDFMNWLWDFARTGRTIVVSIHQPRSEVFHMFHRVILMKKGHVAAFDKPQNLVNLANAWRAKAERKRLPKMASLAEGLNPADFVLDQVKRPDLHHIVISSFDRTRTRARVERSIRRAVSMLNAARDTLAYHLGVLRHRKHELKRLLHGSSLSMSNSNDQQQQQHGRQPHDQQQHQDSLDGVKGPRHSDDQSASAAVCGDGDGGNGDDTEGLHRSHQDEVVERVVDSSDVADILDRIRDNLHRSEKDLYLPNGEDILTTAHAPLRVLLLTGRFLKRLPSSFFVVMALKVLANALGYSWLYSNAQAAYVVLSCNFSLMFGFPFLLANSFGSRIMTYLEAFRLEAQIGVVNAFEVILGMFIAMSASVLPLCLALYTVVYGIVYWDAFELERVLGTSLIQLLNVQVLNALFLALCGLCHRNSLSARHALAYFTSIVGVFAALSGFLVSPGDATDPQLVLYHTSPLYFVFSAAAKMGLNGLSLVSCQEEAGVLASFVCEAQSPSGVLSLRGYDTVSVGLMLLALLGWNILLLIVAAMAISESPLPALRLSRDHPSVWRKMSKQRIEQHGQRYLISFIASSGNGNANNPPATTSTSSLSSTTTTAPSPPRATSSFKSSAPTSAEHRPSLPVVDEDDAGHVFVLPAVKRLTRPRGFFSHSTQSSIRFKHHPQRHHHHHHHHHQHASRRSTMMSDDLVSVHHRPSMLLPVAEVAEEGEEEAKEEEQPGAMQHARQGEREGLILDGGVMPDDTAARTYPKWSSVGSNGSSVGGFDTGGTATPSLAHADGTTQLAATQSHRNPRPSIAAPAAAAGMMQARAMGSLSSIGAELRGLATHDAGWEDVRRASVLDLMDLPSSDDEDDDDDEQDLQTAQNEMLMAISGVLGQHSTRAVHSWLTQREKNTSALLEMLANPRNRWQRAVYQLLKKGALQAGAPQQQEAEEEAQLHQAHRQQQQEQWQHETPAASVPGVPPQDSGVCGVDDVPAHPRASKRVVDFSLPATHSIGSYDENDRGDGHKAAHADKNDNSDNKEDEGGSGVRQTSVSAVRGPMRRRRARMYGRRATQV
ncbi:hypothetical protein PTSG_05724 [Salpingoeca rosetta]|uniref:ABC transporter domain-containing protein n=1 Tax=Salpingoeca rosetta (strain ATCC 50818 / BSB-021) TaxID=946362 RepID=F2UB14_SALR5|nr:uncharacterized protein PTSG_05724 [Salpingoeca rosetta]EGD74027.1 hypothetical protein PTSG_05724 [Salpingoeca rosetta]|eukprot:XP_004993589.1 hypothetical protein PTSG_05724 [Salpingoeca rosetta]